MEPAYPSGCSLWISPVTPQGMTPARGEVVALRAPAARGRVDVKRVVGLPGETVAWGGGAIHINGVPLEEPYAVIPRAVPGDDDPQQVALGPEDYFVLGDNRLYSADSRRYGPVSHRAMLGKIVGVSEGSKARSRRVGVHA